MAADSVRRWLIQACRCGESDSSHIQRSLCDVKAAGAEGEGVGAAGVGAAGVGGGGVGVRAKTTELVNSKEKNTDANARYDFMVSPRT